MTAGTVIVEHGTTTHRAIKALMGNDLLAGSYIKEF
jgi:hypothetical protein